MTATSESRIAEIRASLESGYLDQHAFAKCRDLLAHIDALKTERDGLQKGVQDANWEASSYVDAGGGIKGLLRWIGCFKESERMYQSKVTQLESANQKAVEALEALSKEADSHWEHNPVSGKDRLPLGYQKIGQMALEALHELTDGPAPSQPETLTGADQDRRIRDTVALIADYVSPEGLDPEEWGQLCELAEKILRLLNLWQPETPKTGE